MIENLGENIKKNIHTHEKKQEPGQHPRTFRRGGGGILFLVFRQFLGHLAVKCAYLFHLRIVI